VQKYWSKLPRAEKANSISHFLGVILSVVAFYLFLNRTNDLNMASWPFFVFAGSMLLLYFASTLYHLAVTSGRKRIYKIIDHSAIFCLIAGTYTPFAVVTLHGESGEQLLILIWSIALAGITYKLFLTGKYKLVSTLIYLAMGWVAIFYMQEILKKLPIEGFVWLVVGGASYSLGVIFYLRKREFSHAVWHFFVLGGSFCHFISIYSYVLPM
jgi:hemolysin III